MKARSGDSLKMYWCEVFDLTWPRLKLHRLCSTLMVDSIACVCEKGKKKGRQRGTAWKTEVCVKQGSKEGRKRRGWLVMERRGSPARDPNHPSHHSPFSSFIHPSLLRLFHFSTFFFSLLLFPLSPSIVSPSYAFPIPTLWSGFPLITTQELNICRILTCQEVSNLFIRLQFIRNTNTAY
jgi:hypothetical protein